MLKESSAEPIRKQHRLVSTLIGQLNQVDSVIGRSLSLHCSWAVAVAVAIRNQTQRTKQDSSHRTHKNKRKRTRGVFIIGSRRLSIGVTTCKLAS